MSSASASSATRLRMKFRSRPCSRSIASESRWSCSAIIQFVPGAASIYLCRRIKGENIAAELEKIGVSARPCQDGLRVKRTGRRASGKLDRVFRALFFAVLGQGQFNQAIEQVAVVEAGGFPEF